MKKIIIISAVALAVAACGNNPNKPVDDSTPKKENKADSLVGDWITTGEEATGELSDTMGITISKDGKAQSINMPTYQYKSWTFKNDTIVLTAVSTAEGMPADTSVVDTGIVDFDAKTISLYGGDVVYKKK